MPMDDDFAQGLKDWLDSTDERYVVERTLKDSPNETTQVVYRRDEHGQASIGPFIRKRLRGDAGLGLAYEQVFRAQAQGTQLVHLPLVYEYSRTNDTVEVVMEFLHGETLREAVLREGPSVGLAARVYAPLCDAASEMHESFEQPLIHRDIKPSNVMLCNGQLKLIDLGIARAYRSDAQRDTVRYGTPGYAPPEQFGYGQTSTRSDVYALGMTLAFCLTGEEPTAALRERKFSDPRIPSAMAEVLSRATEFDPERRHQSAHALKNDFAHALETLRPSDPGQPKAKKFTTLGRVWNVVLILLWALWIAACISNIIRSPEENYKFPLWFIVLEHIGLLMIPATAIVYALLDKRRFVWRKLSWKIEVLICVGIVMLCLISIVIVQHLAFGDR